MNAGWNYRREHLRLQQRSHYVITNGGDQPNVVPRNAGVWYYFRETNYEGIKNLWDIGDKMAEGASLMTNTKWSSRVLGSAWPSHMNRTLAETMHANIARWACRSGPTPTCSWPRRRRRSSACRRSVSRRASPTVRGRESQPDEDKRGGGSDDIGDISWTVPTVSLSFPANFQAGPGHNWANAIADGDADRAQGHDRRRAGPGDDAARPASCGPTWSRRRGSTSTRCRRRIAKYTPLLRPQDQPAIHLNKAIMDRYRPEMRKFYYDPTRYKTYLEQLGINIRR